MTKRIYDSSVRPQDDYFGYINNPWLHANPIPASESTWGTFYVLRENSWRAVDAIVSELRNTPNSNGDQHLLKTFFDVALSFSDKRQNHLELISDMMSRVRMASSPTMLAHEIGRMHRRGQSAFWTFYVELDDKDNQSQAIKLQQAGLSLPNRDYYLDDTDNMKNIRQKYREFYDQVISYASEPSLLPFDQLFKIERSLAEAAWPDAALRDVHKTYNKMSQKTLRSTYPSFDWSAYFDGLGWQSPNDEIIVGQPSYVAAVCDILVSQPIEIIRGYLCWRIINAYLSWIDEHGAELSFEFYGKILGGTSEMKPLWKRAVLQADSLPIGELLGREYAKRHFPASSKSNVTALVEEIRAAYHHRIDQLGWMSPTTKQRAHTKLDAINVFVGYPSVWNDFSQLTLDPDNHLANVIRLREFDTSRELAKIGQPPAREEWYMNAHTVNAYNHPTRLEIVFPAAILQTPFYDPNASHAANLGGIGAVIGHEFTHGFDDQGADYDEHGMMNRWQSDSERQEFDRLASTIAREANSFEVAPKIFLQGDLIMGEAIADIGGLQLAVTALANSMSKPDAKKTSALKELFENFAACECGHATLERQIELAKTDPHPPSKFRVNHVVRHIDEFYDSYAVTPDDKLYIDKCVRAQIW